MPLCCCYTLKNHYKCKDFQINNNKPTRKKDFLLESYSNELPKNVLYKEMDVLRVLKSKVTGPPFTNIEKLPTALAGLQVNAEI